MESVPGAEGAVLLPAEKRPEKIEQAEEADGTALVAVVVQASS